MTTYNTKGTCSRAINYEVADGVVTKCEIATAPPAPTSWPEPWNLKSQARR